MGISGNWTKGNQMPRNAGRDRGRSARNPMVAAGGRRKRLKGPSPVCTVQPADLGRPVQVEEPVATMTVRVFVRPHGDHYFACCIDLNVAAEAPTPEEAQAKLKEAVHNYLLTVVGREGASGFRPRPAPLPLKAEYWYWRILTSTRLCQHRQRASRKFDAYKQNLALSPAGP